MVAQISASNPGSPKGYPALQRTGSGGGPDSQTDPPTASEAFTNLAVRTLRLPLYGAWKPTVSGGTVGKKVAVAKKRSGGGARVSAKRPVVNSRPKTAPDVRRRKPLRLGDRALGRGLELQTAVDESGGPQTGEPCSKRHRGGPIPGGDLPPEKETLFAKNGSADAPSERLEDLPLLHPFLSLPQGWSPGTFMDADAPGRNGPSAPEPWCLQGIEGRRTIESTGHFDRSLGGRMASPVGNGGPGHSELGSRREHPVDISWPIELQFGRERKYPVVEERSKTTAAVSWANPPCKTGFHEDPLPEDGVNDSNGAVHDLNAGANDLNYGVDNLTGGLDDLNTSITALLTDHMRALLEAQEAQFGAAGPECPVEFSPGQVARILDQQGQLRAALEYFKTLTGSEATGVSPSTGENYSPGQPSLSGTQSYAPETVCPEKRVPVGGPQSGFEEKVSGRGNGFGGKWSAAHAGSNRTSGLAKAQNGRVGRAQGPLLVPLVYRPPLDALAEPAEDVTWQLENTRFEDEWSAQGHVPGPLWAEQVGLGSLF